MAKLQKEQKEHILNKIELDIKLCLLIRYIKKKNYLPKRILQDLEDIHRLWVSIK